MRVPVGPTSRRGERKYGVLFFGRGRSIEAHRGNREGGNKSQPSNISKKVKGIENCRIRRKAERRGERGFWVVFKRGREL